MAFLGELMNIGLINVVNFIECLYDLESGAEQERYFISIIHKVHLSISIYCYQPFLMLLLRRWRKTKLNSGTSLTTLMD